MEEAVPAMFGRPILIKVSLSYRFTTVTVDPQVPTIQNEFFDVVYIGTGKLQTTFWYTVCELLVLLLQMTER